MHVLPIATPLLRSGMDLAKVLCEAEKFQENDIVVVSSKAVATVEGASIDLSKVKVSANAEEHAKRTGESARFCQAVLEETVRMHGWPLGTSPHVVLTELQPEGLEMGTLLVPNAGLDMSNIEEGFAIGWPKNVPESVQALREKLEEYTGVKLAVILGDSCCHPRRLGVTAFALAVSGMNPIVSKVGAKDLFGKPMRMTYEALADQLATAANFHMGNTNEQKPAAIIREHGLPLAPFEGWVPGVDPEEDLFQGVFTH